MKSIENLATDLRHFDAIGVTDQELERSLHRRLVSVAKLRKILDDAKVTAPLHIFGALDPITTPLFFLAGADIFDGLSWLRFAFVKGMAVYHDNAIVVAGDARKPYAQAVVGNYARNLIALQDMAATLKKFVDTENWDVFGDQAALFKEITEKVMTEARVD